MIANRDALFTIHGGGLRIDPASVDYTSAAVMLIDMQYLDAHPDFGQGLAARQAGVAETYAHYFASLGQPVIPNLSRVLETARETGVEVIHTRIGSLTTDGREISPVHRELGVVALPGTREIDFLDELAPLENEVVITKGASGAFNSTAIDQLLRNLGIRTLIVGGVVTNYCVETTVRDAADRGYGVLLLADGCAAYSEVEQQHALQIVDRAYATVTTTDAVCEAMVRSSTRSADRADPATSRRRG